MRRPLLPFIVGCVLVGCDSSGGGPTGPDQPAETQAPLDLDRIAFATLTNDQEGIKSIRLDGTDSRWIVEGRIASDLDWSPVGDKILYSWQNPRPYGATMSWVSPDGDSSAIVKAGDDNNRFRHGTWSRDGRQISYVQWRSGNGFAEDTEELRVKDAGTSYGGRAYKDIAVTTDLLVNGRGLGPFTWVPGDRCVIYAETFDNGEGQLNGLRFEDEAYLTIPATDEENRPESDPDVSPDGLTILYVADGDIWKFSFEDGNIFNLTNGAGTNRSPRWSPDGSRIAFVSDRDGDLDIYIMDANGGSVRNLTNDSFPNWSPTWSPVSEGEPTTQTDVCPTP